MNYWAKASGLYLFLASGFVSGFGSIVFKNYQISLPNLTGGPMFGMVSILVFLSLCPVIYFGHLLARSLFIDYLRSVRQLKKLEVAATLAFIAMQTAGILTSSNFGIPAWSVLQNTMILLGLFCSSLSIFTVKIASLTPTLWVFTCAMFGHNFQEGGIHRWAFIIQDEPTAIGWIASTIVFSLGLVQVLARTHKSRIRIYASCK